MSAPVPGDAVGTCPSCASPIAPSDAFCEACGAELVPVGVAIDTDQVVDPGAPRTQLIDGVGAMAVTCHLCGAAIADDGFCSVCGQRARSPREHWTETPATWVGGVCDRGVVHPHNEDAMSLRVVGTLAVLVVCDGVTTAPESDRAALAGSRAAAALLAAETPPTGSVAGRLTDWQQRHASACRAANAEAVAVAHALGDPPEPPSCTYVAAVVEADLVTVAWCGDSRAYWLADDGSNSIALSLDHSLGTEMIAAGRTREEAEADPSCHTITRWLGADSIDPTPEMRSVAIDRPGWVLVVSDGMWNYASTLAELAGLITAAEAGGAVGPTGIAESLAGFANAEGGHDNVTVALARCEPQLP